MSESIFRVKTTNSNLVAHMRHLAGGEGNDAFEYDLLIQGADRIEKLEAQLEAVREWANSHDMTGTTLHAQKRLHKILEKSE